MFRTANLRSRTKPLDLFSYFKLGYVEPDELGLKVTVVFPAPGSVHA